MDIDREVGVEKILWSMALSGFGQILNGKLFKCFAFIVLEIIINIKSNINEIIMLSFQGNTFDAVEHTNYLWVLFYPSIYMFSIWDAFRDSGGCRTPYVFFPFVFHVYLGTIGIIYSSVFRVGSIFLGPVWLPIICLILGVLVGTAIQHFFIRFNNKKSLFCQL